MDNRELSSVTKQLLRKTGYNGDGVFPRAYPYSFFERCSIQEVRMMSILDMLNGCDVYDMMRFYSLDAHKNYQAYYTQATDACEFSPSADSQHSHFLLLSVNPTEGERGPFQLVAVHSLAHIRSMLRCDLRSWHSVVSSKRSGERGCIEQHAGFAGERRRVHSKPCGRGGCGSRLDQRSDAAEEESGGDRELSGRHADSLHAGAGRRG